MNDGIVNSHAVNDNIRKDVMTEVETALGDGESTTVEHSPFIFTLPTSNVSKVMANDRISDSRPSPVAISQKDDPSTLKSAPTITLSSSSSIRSDSDDEDIIDPRKRKRTVKNFVTDESDDDSADDSHSYSVLLPKKRIQFNVNSASNGVYVGDWAHSPQRLDSRKHAVYAYLDRTGKMRTRVHPETKDGHELVEGFPTGPGLSMIGSKDVNFDSHLLYMSHEQRKKYVQSQLKATEGVESPTDHVRVEKDVLPGNIEDVEVRQDAEVVHETVSPLYKVQPRIITMSTPQKSRINGVLLGYWMGSMTPQVVDRHAAYGNIQADGKFRVRIVKETRDGRPMPDFYPVGPGAQWIDFDDVILEPHLAAVTRLEIKEYTRYMQLENLDELSDSQRKEMERTALVWANEKVLERAKSAGRTLKELDADDETARRQQRLSRKGGKARGTGVSDLSGMATPRVFRPTPKKTYLPAEIPNSEGRGTPRSSSKKKDDYDAAITRSMTSELDKTTQPKARALRTAKAEARAVRLRIEKEAALERAAVLSNTEYAKSDLRMKKGGLTTKLDGPVCDVGEDLLPAMTRKPSRIPPGGYPVERDAVKSVEKAKGNSRSTTSWGDLEDYSRATNTSASGEKMKRGFNGNTDKQQTVPGDGGDTVIIYNGVRFQRNSTGPFAGKLVGNERSVVTINGEDYVKYEILMRTQF